METFVLWLLGAFVTLSVLAAILGTFMGWGDELDNYGDDDV